MASEAQKRASKKYDKSNTKGLLLKFNLNTDSDILKYLDTLNNKQGHIKKLIRQDMEIKK